MTDRYSPLRELARQHALDAVALVPGANFTRLMHRDFHSHERPLLLLVPQTGRVAAIVPNLELASFATLDFEGDVFDWRDQDGYQPAFDALLAAHPQQRIGVEGQVMRVFVQQALVKAQPGIDIVDLQKPIASLRLCKNADEIDALRRAIAVSEQALRDTIADVRIGQTEKAIEARLIQALFQYGADDLSFGPIVAAGDNSAQPHAHARSDYAIRDGDALLFDFGARVDGLCADITRTFFIGHCSDTQRAIYDTVLAANLAGHAAVRPGATAGDIDDAATRVLEESEWQAFIRHKTGHGLGRDVHEDPYIMRGNTETLAPGMVFTIEPGLYRQGDFGVRIEDDVVVTGDGVESLTTFDKSLQVLDPR